MLMLPTVTYPALVPHNRACGVGRGLFARRALPRGTVLVCADVPCNAPDRQLWHAGKEVRGAGGTAYGIGKGRRGGGARTIYMLNCTDPKGTVLTIAPEVSRSERRALLDAAAVYKTANCKFVERKHGGRWVLGIQITRSVVAGEQLIIPCYLR
eukprot:COSAG01_NODE_7558_length_3150_cov_3.446411_4_plen_154_part_00